MDKSLIKRDSPPVSLIWGVIGIFIILSIGGAWFFRQQRNQARHQTEERLLTIARFKATEIAQWRAARLHDAAVLAGDPFFLEAAHAWTQSPDPIIGKKILNHFRTIQTQYSYWNILLTTPEGKNVLVLEGPPGGVLGETASKSLAEALNNKNVVMTDLIPGAGPLPIRLDTIAPLILPSAKEAVPFGALVLVSDVQTYLYPLIQSWPMPSATAESLLIRRDGDYVLFLNELRHRKNTAFNLRFPLTQTSLPAVMAVQGRESVVEGLDYRGIKVFSAHQPIAGTDWHLVAKTDATEALDFWHSRSLMIIGLTIALFLAAVAMVWAAWQRRMTVSYRLNLETEKARHATEQRYETTLMCIGDGVIVTDDKGMVTLLNPIAEKLTGWTRDEAMGRPVESIFNICNEDTRQQVDNPIQKVLETGRTVGLANHTVLISTSGIEYPIMDSSAPIRDANGGLIGIVLVFRDQTAERNAERSLRVERDNLQAILRASPVGLLVFNEEEYLLTASPEAERMFQKNLSSAERLRCGEFLGCLNHAAYPEGCGEAEPCAVCALNRAIRGALRDGKGFHQDCTLERQANGYQEKLFLSFGAEPVFLEGRRHAVVVIQDISDRILAEQKNERLTQQLQQAMKMEAIGRLAGGVAHDFNNLLTGIGGYTELLMSNLNPQDPMLEDLNEIKNATKRAVTLTSQLLAFSRKQLIEPRVLSLNDLVTGLQKMLQRLIGEDIELNLILNEQLASVKIDAGQYEQILINMAVNARDAMPDGGKLTIETANADLDEDYQATHPYITPGLHVMIAVSDTGCGMSAEVKSHLFEPFYTTKQKGRGTGLGLATIYGAVKQSGGSIEVYSEPEKGTTFRIYLPAIALPAEILDIDKSQHTALPGGEETILLVEDEQIVRELAAKILKRLKYNILSASNGAEALGIAQSHTGIINLLITDVVMPGMNGRQLAEQLQLMRPQIKVLYTSGYTENAIAHHGIIDSNLNFIGKPYNSRDLAYKIRRILD